MGGADVLVGTDLVGVGVLGRRVALVVNVGAIVGVATVAGGVKVAVAVKEGAGVWLCVAVLVDVGKAVAVAVGGSGVAEGVMVMVAVGVVRTARILSPTRLHTRKITTATNSPTPIRLNHNNGRR